MTLDAAQSQPVSVNCRTIDGTAVAPEDYTELNETLTFAANDTSETCSLATIDDTDSEGIETLMFGLTSVSGIATESDGSGGVEIGFGHDSFEVSILDNDQPASTLSLRDFPLGIAQVNEGAGSFEVRVTLTADLPIILPSGAKLRKVPQRLPRTSRRWTKC